MKLLKFLIITILVICGIGYGAYYFGTNVAAEKIVTAVSEELENSGQLDRVKALVKDDPEVRKFLEEGANVDASTLPFTTKEQAVRTVIRKVGVSELRSIQSKAQRGMSVQEQAALLKEVEGKLSDEEITALKYVVYKELYQ